MLWVYMLYVFVLIDYDLILIDYMLVLWFSLYFVFYFNRLHYILINHMASGGVFLSYLIDYTAF